MALSFKVKICTVVKIIVTLDIKDDAVFIKDLMINNVKYHVLEDVGVKKRFLLEFNDYTQYYNFISGATRIDSCLFLQKE